MVIGATEEIDGPVGTHAVVVPEGALNPSSNSRRVVDGRSPRAAHLEDFSAAQVFPPVVSTSACGRRQIGAALDVVPGRRNDHRQSAVMHREERRAIVNVMIDASDEHVTRRAIARCQLARGAGKLGGWRADGRELFFIGVDKQLMAVPVSTHGAFRAGTAHALFLTDLDPNGLGISGRNQYVAAPSGERFLVNQARPGAASPPVTVLLNWTAALTK